MDAGAETTASYLQNFVISLLQSPESQRKAQKEIDSIVGGDRFPVLADFEQLPYIKALVKEVRLILMNVLCNTCVCRINSHSTNQVFRFRPIFPVGLPHVTTEDIACKGYHIPRDSIIFMNICKPYLDRLLAPCS
jgi:cytochrome P450